MRKISKITRAVFEKTALPSNQSTNQLLPTTPTLKLTLSKLEYYFLYGKGNFSAIHPTHITTYRFWRTMVSSKILLIIRKSYILTVKNNDNWTFLIFFVFTIVFSLEQETKLYYLSIAITTDTSPEQMGCSRTKTLKFNNFSHFQIVISNNPPPTSVIMMHWVRKSKWDSTLTFPKFSR